MRRELTSVDLEGKHLMDIGCGSGAIALLLVKDYGGGHVTGIDVEDPACAPPRRCAEAAGVADHVTIRKLSCSPFSFEYGSLDSVFLKDSIIHIPDKAALAAEAFRVLKPGWRFAAADWLMAHDNEPSREMVDYIRADDLDFAMASPTSYRRAMDKARFVDVELDNRDSWHRMWRQSGTAA